MPGRVHPRPIWVWRERVGVVPRGDVAGQPGIGIGAPGPAELIALLVDAKRLDPREAQLGRHADARHAGADNRYTRRAQRRLSGTGPARPRAERVVAAA